MSVASQTETPICPDCRKAMQLLRVRSTRDRRFGCVDCGGEDPLHSPEIIKLLQSVRPPE